MNNIVLCTVRSNSVLNKDIMIVINTILYFVSKGNSDNVYYINYMLSIYIHIYADSD